MKRASMLGLAIILLSVPLPANAQRLRLAVSDCGGPTRATWACDTNEGTAVDVVASVIAPALTMWTGQESTIEFAFPVEVPEWWKAGTGQCRAIESMAVSFDGSATSCADPMSEVGVSGGYIYLVGPQSDMEGPIDPFHVRLRTASAAGPAVPPEYGAVAEGEELFLFRLTIDRQRSFFTGLCLGCQVCALVQFRRLILTQPAGVGDFDLSGEESTLLDLQVLAGEEGHCSPTAARQSTWGQVKSLYR